MFRNNALSRRSWFVVPSIRSVTVLLFVQSAGCTEDKTATTVDATTTDTRSTTDAGESDAALLIDAYSPDIGSPSDDPDGDGLTNGDELNLTRTNPLQSDTDGNGVTDSDEDPDRDGLSNLLEVTGDCLAFACSPLHKDILVEVRYQMLTAKQTQPGRSASLRPSDAFVAALEEFYASLPLTNPDEVNGIHLVVARDDEHIISNESRDFDCYDEQGAAYDAAGEENPAWNGDRRARFHRAKFCWNGTDLRRDVQGVGGISDQTFKIKGQTVDLDPSNDLDEEIQWDWYAMFIHELGHNMSLLHGGNNDINYKPNYPSVMNYRYSFGFPSSARTLRDGHLDFSHGEMPEMLGCMREDDEFIAYKELFESGLPPIPVTTTYVDWNGNGTQQRRAVPTGATNSMDFSDAVTCEQTLRDQDDFARLEERLACALGAELPQYAALCTR